MVNCFSYGVNYWVAFLWIILFSRKSNLQLILHSSRWDKSQIALNLSKVRMRQIDSNKFSIVKNSNSSLFYFEQNQVLLSMLPGLTVTIYRLLSVESTYSK